jgi:glycerophosphoryl diester phosphodiesterase
MKDTEYFEPRPPQRPRLLAHRGLTFRGQSQVLDENTLSAFELALENGADYLESDIRVSSDGVALLFHDANLVSPGGKKLTIAKLSFRQIQSIALPMGGKIPTLAEALERFPTAKFNLDIKTAAAELPGMRTILEADATNRVLVSSFSEASRKRALALSPGKIATSAGSSLVLSGYLAARAGNLKLFRSVLKDVDALQLPTSRYGLDFTHRQFLEMLSQSKLELHYWTINDPNQMQKLFQLGAHGIVTDRVDLAAKFFS